MPSKLNDLGPCEKEISVTIPGEDVDAALQKQFGELRKQIVLPGFRPGRVPRGVLEKRFGDQVRHEVYHDLVREGVEEAIKEHEIEPVSEPEVAGGDDHDSHQLPAEGPLEFSFKVEIKPEFDLPKYRGIEVTRRKEPVTEEQVDDVLARLADGHADWQPVEDDGCYEEGDLVSALASVKVGDHVVLDEQAVTFLPEQEILEGLEFKDAKKIAAESKIDDEIAITVKIPDAHADKEIAGRDGTGRLSIEGYKRRAVPAIDDAFAQTVGKENLAAFRADVGKELQEEHDKLADRDVVQSIINQLLEATEIPLAEGPTQRMLDRKAQQQVMHYQIEEGLSAEDAKAKVDAGMDEMRESIQRDTRAWLLVERIAQKEKIFCLEDDVDTSLAELAQRHDAKPSKVREYYEQQGLMAELRSEIVERKVCEYLRDQARIADEEAGSGESPTADAAEDA